MSVDELFGQRSKHDSAAAIVRMCAIVVCVCVAVAIVIAGAASFFARGECQTAHAIATSRLASCEGSVASISRTCNSDTRVQLLKVLALASGSSFTTLRSCVRTDAQAAFVIHSLTTKVSPEDIEPGPSRGDIRLGGNIFLDSTRFDHGSATTFPHTLRACSKCAVTGISDSMMFKAQHVFEDNGNIACVTVFLSFSRGNARQSGHVIQRRGKDVFDIGALAAATLDTKEDVFSWVADKMMCDVSNGHLSLCSGACACA